MAASSSENKFSISWHDSAWIPFLSAENVLDYFCQRSNTFYDKTCNNEQVKMQRLDSSQLEYVLLCYVYETNAKIPYSLSQRVDSAFT